MQNNQPATPMQPTQASYYSYPRPAGYYSNSIIIQRNRGVTHQFVNDIGGCADNYR